MTYETIEVEAEQSPTVHILTGTITAVGSGSGNTVDINIDGHGAVSDVGVFYHCPSSETADGMPFVVGDDALVVNYGSAVAAENMKVVGFEDGLPRDCKGTYVLLEYTSGAIHRCTVWDTPNNKLAEFKDAQGDPIVFPCDYSEIEAFLPAISDSDTINWAGSSPYSDLDTCALDPIDCDNINYDFDYSHSTDCSDEEATPGRSGKIDTVSSLCTCACDKTYENTNEPPRYYIYSLDDCINNVSREYQWYNVINSKYAIHGGFTGNIHIEKTYSLSGEHTYWHEHESWNSPFEYYTKRDRSCVAAQVESYTVTIPIMPGVFATRLFTEDRSAETHWVSPISGAQTYNSSCSDEEVECLWNFQTKNKISDKVIVNVFVEQDLAKTTLATGGSSTFPPEPCDYDGLWGGYHCIYTPCDLTALPAGDINYGNRLLTVAASIDYLEGGTTGVNPFNRTVHSVFTAAVETLINDYYTQAGVSATSVDMIPLNVEIY